MWIGLIDVKHRRERFDGAVQAGGSHGADILDVGGQGEIGVRIQVDGGPGAGYDPRRWTG